MPKIKKRLGQILVDEGVITEEVMEKALRMQKESGEKLGEVLVNMGFTTEEQIVNAVKEQLGIPLINLDNINVSQNIIDILPVSTAKKHETIPIDIVNGSLLVVMSDPLNYFAIEDIKVATGYHVKTAIALRNSILKNIDKYYGKSKAQEAVQDYRKNFANRTVENDRELADETAAPVIKFLNTIIENAMLYNASDIHIEPDEKEMRVRFRVDGMLREIMRTDIDMLSAVISRVKIMASLNIAENRIPQDGRINFKVKQHVIDIRVSTIPTILGEKIVMRLLDKSSFSMDLEKIGLENDELTKLKRMIASPYGIIMVSGPTGSGKTTTLYSILNILNDVSKNIITIEDPVEYNLKGINQMQVNTKIGFDFASGLRSILRQDPDIILVGEIRDNETAEISIRSALTGHLVLSTIHTNNAVGTIGRLLDMGVKPFLISSTLAGVVAQRLVRKICPSCAEEYMSDEREMRILGIKEPVKLKRGKGCSLCNNTGYRGRIGIFEILEIDNDIKNIIDTDYTENKIEKLAVDKGMNTLRKSCISKVLNGVTTVEEMLRATYGDGI
ncbi:GspE/PulE family protein [Clostridium autoethanogenum]|uniref:Flp pilus assembly complex ATPase component TadA n=1 Tax=Clostridium autoethanogenum DSM 10061 TaxID=1341692 RepID=A0ABM5NWI2_9CLOT|nr:ATPase, T2SS/T4P/T4SS family [Clostridium autoethanogenum]AGY76852.1 Flp pilus assembly complex ATPase component TadA [Clostridium autoethanogenum DSM 10061]ALU37001.1 Type II secretion system protein E [Clostridium autoethanogenum DSM 10061]OVY48697.1 Type II secretion system protein E [Clostridium autoethanogenum]